MVSLTRVMRRREVGCDDYRADTRTWINLGTLMERRSNESTTNLNAKIPSVWELPHSVATTLMEGNHSYRILLKSSLKVVVEGAYLGGGRGRRFTSGGDSEGNSTEVHQQEPLEVNLD